MMNFTYRDLLEELQEMEKMNPGSLNQTISITIGDEVYPARTDVTEEDDILEAGHLFLRPLNETERENS